MIKNVLRIGRLLVLSFMLGAALVGPLAALNGADEIASQSAQRGFVAVANCDAVKEA
jgi:hypothetical protein